MKHLDSVTFYDVSGEAIAYSQDARHVYGFDGAPLAYFVGGAVWNFDGRYLGQFEDGWIRDEAGDAALFSSQAIGGPAKPRIADSPIKAAKQTLPVKRRRRTALFPSRPTLKWSRLSGRPFFV